MSGIPAFFGIAFDEQLAIPGIMEYWSLIQPSTKIGANGDSI